MTELQYEVSFVTPAFLGNAGQQAQWRTPPFKALMRQWWRIVKAPEVGYDWKRLLHEERLIFGAAGEKEAPWGQSRVRLRLDQWKLGGLTKDKWPRKEIAELQVGQGRVAADVYIGYGPVLAASRKENRPLPQLDRSAVIPGERNNLRIGFAHDVSDDEAARVQQTLALVNWFGCVGSRSRNGWGSLELRGLRTIPASSADLSRYTRALADCFMLDWPHAIGRDKAGPLAWVARTPAKHWREALLHLATIRRDIRAAAKQHGRGEDVSANQLVGYPVTKSGNQAWGEKRRFASPLRLKLVRTQQGLMPVAVHLPSALPEPLFRLLGARDQRWVRDHQLGIWDTVHAALDAKMKRFGAQA